MPFIFRSRLTDGQPLNVLGDSQTLLFGADDTAGAFALIDQENPPGFQVPLNLNEIHDETNYVISGEVEFQVGSNVKILRSGDSIHIPRGVAHRFRVVGKSPSRMLLMFHPAGLESLFRELNLKFPPGAPLDIAELNQVCRPYGTRVLEL